MNRCSLMQQRARDDLYLAVIDARAQQERFMHALAYCFQIMHRAHFRSHPSSQIVSGTLEFGSN